MTVLVKNNRNETLSGVITLGAGLVIAGGNVSLSSAGGASIATSSSQKLAFYGGTPIVQRSGAAQASVATTAATNSSPYGFSTSAQADALVTLCNELRAALVALGLIKGSA